MELAELTELVRLELDRNCLSGKSGKSCLLMWCVIFYFANLVCCVIERIMPSGLFLCFSSISNLSLSVSSLPLVRSYSRIIVVVVVAVVYCRRCCRCCLLLLVVVVVVVFV